MRKAITVRMNLHTNQQNEHTPEMTKLILNEQQQRNIFLDSLLTVDRNMGLF